ncbi:hypothetical protein D0469_16545 [Peribacillus saganii]|uniref:Uncharacterized protein n=1 Tax=Peribacillus saganii TaxID=2303992 RepID=A0A372LK77_9BACI|nr:hypothetical protein D0469_16545 [Peribacillus saganii]
MPAHPTIGRTAKIATSSKSRRFVSCDEALPKHSLFCGETGTSTAWALKLDISYHFKRRNHSLVTSIITLFFPILAVAVLTLFDTEKRKRPV